jgi:hypothetical protein
VTTGKVATPSYAEKKVTVIRILSLNENLEGIFLYSVMQERHKDNFPKGRSQNICPKLMF